MGMALSKMSTKADGIAMTGGSYLHDLGHFRWEAEKLG